MPEVTHEKEALIVNGMKYQNGVMNNNNNFTRTASNFRQSQRSSLEVPQKRSFKRRWEKDEERRSIVWTGPEILWAETAVTSI